MAGSAARRLAPEQRKALLIDAAEETFTARGYTQAGLAEVAELAGVSKTLPYHYFPDGRPALYREVLHRLVGEVVAAVRAATRAPTAGGARMEGLSLRLSPTRPRCRSTGSGPGGGGRHRHGHDPLDDRLLLGRARRR